eukprot:2375949-Prymnesium_polylepis.1
MTAHDRPIRPAVCGGRQRGAWYTVLAFSRTPSPSALISPPAATLVWPNPAVILRVRAVFNQFWGGNGQNSCATGLTLTGFLGTEAQVSLGLVQRWPWSTMAAAALGVQHARYVEQ